MQKPFFFQPGDVLVFRLGKGEWGVLNPLIFWATQGWSHAAIYYTETKQGLPLIIESRGRGVNLVSLFQHLGRMVVVRRWQGSEEVGRRAAKEAERLADNPRSWYGYWDIPRFVAPRLLVAKLGQYLPSPARRLVVGMAFSYRHNDFYICSELVAEAYQRAGFPIWEERVIPLPGDFLKSERLETVWEGVVELPPG